MSKGEMSLEKCQSMIYVTSLFVKHLTLNKLGESHANMILSSQSFNLELAMSIISTGEVSLRKKLKPRCKHHRVE
jgi:hypothetical protein